MPSFDIVSQVDMQELDNALNNVKKEVATRYDFRGSETQVELNKKEKKIHIVSSDEMKMNALRDMLIGHCIRRKVDAKTLDFKEFQPTSKGHLKMDVEIKEGLSDEIARKIVKMIKEKKLKVQAAIQGDQVRVTAKKIDDLQTVIGMCREGSFDLPLQYVNMKS